jgi:penicillin-binding protein 1C
MNRAVWRRLVFALVLWLALPAHGEGLAPPPFAAVKEHYLPSEAWLLDRNGEVLAQRRVDMSSRRLQWVALAELSPVLQQVLVASEDKRFYEHAGVDWTALASAAWDNLFHHLGGRHARGASTITMQLASFLDASLHPRKSERTLAQKWQQMAAAQAIEATWSKQQILEAYLNLAPFRGELTGIHAASRAMFGKHPSGLNRSEAILLVALLKEPGAKALAVAKHACAALAAVPAAPGQPNCDELRRLAIVTLDNTQLTGAEESLAPHLAQRYLSVPGSRVRTTLDAKLQRFAIQSLREHLMELSGQEVEDGAVIVLDNASGEVLAYVGSSGSFSDSPEVDGVASLRQAGSTLKPFLYGTALDHRQITAASVIDDSPIQLTTPSGLYIPQNYDHDFKGLVTARTALASSLNVPAVRTLTVVGVDRFVQQLRNFGLGSIDRDGDFYGFALALGGAEVRLTELTNAYRALANQGMWSPLRYTSAQPAAGAHRALSQEASFIIGDILSDPAARATTFGLENPLATRIWAAAKTGTSKDMRDNWCIGYTSRYTVGVWVGNFGGAPMRDVSGVSGAAPVWSDIIHYLHASLPSQQPAPPPERMVHASIRFEPELEPARHEWFIAGTESSVVRIADSEDKQQGMAPKILYPTSDTVIAIDPDIPPAHQKLRLSARNAADVIWLVDGKEVGASADAWWRPTAGRHRAILADRNGNEFDGVTFEVRGDFGAH